MRKKWEAFTRKLYPRKGSSHGYFVDPIITFTNEHYWKIMVFDTLELMYDYVDSLDKEHKPTRDYTAMCIPQFKERETSNEETITMYPLLGTLVFSYDSFFANELVHEITHSVLHTLSVFWGDDAIDFRDRVDEKEERLTYMVGNMTEYASEFIQEYIAVKDLSIEMEDTDVIGI